MLLAQTGGIGAPPQVPSAMPLYVSRAVLELSIASFQSLSWKDFTSHGIDAIIFTTSFFPVTPLSAIITKSADKFALKGFASLFFQASHNFVSEADSFFSVCALVIAGFGFGDEEGAAGGVSCAKEIDAKANNNRAARGRCLFILGFSLKLSRVELIDRIRARSTPMRGRLSINKEFGRPRSGPDENSPALDWTEGEINDKSLKRTTETGRVGLISRPLCGLHNQTLTSIPPINQWAIFNHPLTRTQSKEFFRRHSLEGTAEGYDFSRGASAGL
jgi:hypothetical protein